MKARNTHRKKFRPEPKSNQSLEKFMHETFTMEQEEKPSRFAVSLVMVGFQKGNIELRSSVVESSSDNEALGMVLDYFMTKMKGYLVKNYSVVPVYV